MYAVEQVIQSSSTSYKSVEVVKFSKLHVVHVRNFAKYLEQSKSSIKAKYYYCASLMAQTIKNVHVM